jgi:hypothetical protein
VLVLLISAIGVAATPAVAQDSQDLSQARAKFQQGIELEQAGDWPAALKLFREVGQVRMTPQVRYHIARCEEQLGRLVAALGGFELALEQAEDVGEDFREEVTKSVSELRARIPKLTVERGSGAEAATIELDGIALGDSRVGTSMPVDPGPHAVSAQAPGYQSFHSTVEVGEREEQTVVVELRPLPKETRVPVAPERVEPSPPSRESSPVLIYVAGGVGIAGLAASGVFWGLRGAALSDLEELCPERDCSGIDPEQREDAESTYDRAKLFNTLAPIALGVGVVGVGTAVSLWLLRKPARSDTGWHAVPVAPSGALGLTLHRAF